MQCFVWFCLHIIPAAVALPGDDMPFPDSLSNTVSVRFRHHMIPFFSSRPASARITFGPTPKIKILRFAYTRSTIFYGCRYASQTFAETAVLGQRRPVHISN